MIDYQHFIRITPSKTAGSNSYNHLIYSTLTFTANLSAEFRYGDGGGNGGVQGF